MGLEEQLANERWRRQMEARLDEHMERLDQGDERMTALETKLDANNTMTARIEGNTKELVEVAKAFSGFVTVNGWIGTLAKWVVAVLIAAGLMVFIWKTGELPRRP